MDSNKAAYWIALAVLAVGFGSEYRNGNFAGLHQVADRASAEFCRIYEHGQHAVALATAIGARETVASDESMVAEQAELARAQAEAMRDQVRDAMHAQRDAMRAQVDIRRAQFNQMRWQTASNIRVHTVDGRTVVVCPKTGVRVTLDDNDDFDQHVDVDTMQTF